jgi:hypothetical protein
MENLNNFMKFLEESGVDLKQVKVHQYSHHNLKFTHVIIDGFYYKELVLAIQARPFTKDDCCDDPAPNDTQNIAVHTSPSQVVLSANTMEGTLSGGLRSPKAIHVPQKAILERVKSKSESKSYQLGHKLSMKWSTGAGPRIGCVKDYPAELRTQAMQMVDL